ncbi:transporter [Paraburkholderia sp. FT54]|uniref:transporter n=1 Tax=Paraburkholderia sp. FT54 TaxID=3074437 RepID=UPI002877FF9B|nr:transporter [Paraburkholderia sp. FT54]WNC94789.1 transporter [Paraburkholderia sp. FT54]
MSRLTLNCALRHASAVGLLLSAGTASAQELEPRTYSAAPAGTNFVVFSYTYLTGNVLTDPSLPVTNVQARINAFSAGYEHTFGLAGHTASIAFAIPYTRGNLSGNVIDAPTEVHRAGMGDLRTRFAFNLMGSPALSPEDFARRAPSSSIGLSLTMSAPTGQYVPSRLVNVGTNRWAFKPEVGLSQPVGNWFFEATAGTWIFTTNNNFFRGNKRSQDPLWTFQLHGGYGFGPGFWIAADIGYADGGGSSLNGVPDRDRQSNLRYGLTFSVPLARSWSSKLALSNGFITRAGGNYKEISLTLQYHWFDR